MRVIAVVVLYLTTVHAWAVTTVIHVSSSRPSFKIDLPANATTGYHWVLGAHDDIIQLMSSRYYPSQNTTLIGAPGHTVFQFKVNFSTPCHYVAQMLHLNLVYQRPWEPNAGSVRHYHVVLRCVGQ